MVQSTQGKIEFDTMDDSDSDQVIAALVSLAVRQCFAEHVLLEEAAEIVEAFNTEAIVHTGDDLPDARLPGRARRHARPSTRRRERIAGPDASDGELASAVEFVLEGLYLTKRLAKDASGARALYRSRNR